MTATAALLQTLHRMNRQKTDLQDQLKRGPKVIATARGRYEAAANHVQEIQDTMTKMRMDVDHKQLQMKEREDKIHHWNGQMNAATDNREYQTLKDQIAADTQANVVLSDEILEILEGLDAMEGTLKEAEEQAAGVKVETDKIENQILEKRVQLQADLERVEQELAEAEKGLTGDFKRDYARLVAVKGEDAMAAAEGNCCSGCYQSLTPQLNEQLSLGKPVICPACGRLLYLPNDN